LLDGRIPWRKPEISQHLGIYSAGTVHFVHRFVLHIGRNRAAIHYFRRTVFLSMIIAVVLTTDEKMIETLCTETGGPRTARFHYRSL
jgi:hypothetical protein